MDIGGARTGDESEAREETGEDGSRKACSFPARRSDVREWYAHDPPATVSVPSLGDGDAGGRKRSMEAHASLDASSAFGVGFETSIACALAR